MRFLNGWIDLSEAERWIDLSEAERSICLWMVAWYYLPVGELNREYFDIEKRFFYNELKREYFDNELTLSKLNEKEWEDILHINGKIEY